MMASLERYSLTNPNIEPWRYIITENSAEEQNFYTAGPQKHSGVDDKLPPAALYTDREA